MLNLNIVITGINISFWSDYQVDMVCLKDLLYSHIHESREYASDSHDVIIYSSKDAQGISPDALFRWEGTVNSDMPVRWYESKDGKEKYACINNDIQIQYIPERKLTVCYLLEKKRKFCRTKRPALSTYIFFLLQSILSVHGKYCLHAACVAKGEFSWLFLGKSGEGKSTISYLLSKAGYEFMGDDLVFISKNQQGTLQIDALLCKVKIYNEKIKQKESFDIIKQEGFAFSLRSRIGAIIRLQRTWDNKKSTLLSADPSEVFSWLMEAGNNSRIQNDPEEWVNICVEATTLPAYTLLFADKAHFDPQLLESSEKLLIP